MKILKWFAVALILLLIAILIFVFVSHRQNFAESRNYTEAVRAEAPGAMVQLSQGYTHYHLQGPSDAPVVVLVHGFSIPAEAWGETADVLAAAGYRVLSYDLYGRGYSERPRVMFTGEVFERQLVDLLDALHIDQPVVLAGLSMGGAVVMRTAANHPERVLGQILLAPLHQPLQPPPMPERMGHYMISAFYVPTLRASLEADYLSETAKARMIAAYEAQMQIRGFTRALTSSFYAFTTEDHPSFYRQTRGYDLPTLLIWGENDNVVPFSQAEGVRADAQVVEFLALPEVGHTPHLERPEQVHRTMLQFLQTL